MSIRFTHDLVVASGVIPNRLAPRVLYDNIFRRGTVTVSTEHAAHPKELAYDGLTYDGWQPDSGGEQWIAVEQADDPADAMAVYGSLAGAIVTPQASADGVDWTNLDDPFIPADNRPFVFEFDEDESLHRRLFVEDAPAAFSLAAIQLGMKLELGYMPGSWKPPSLNERKEYSNTMSEGGQILGRHVVRRGVVTQVRSEPITYAWAREDWSAFIAAAEERAFFLWWTLAGKAEIVYGGIAEQHEGAFASPSHLSASFTIEGLNR